MGAALAAELRRAGHDVLWASAGRSGATADRARNADLEDAGTTAELARHSELVLSVCPPHAAPEVASSVGDFDGVYVDANAVSPDTARRVAAVVESARAVFVDGGIVGPPPREPGTTRLYLSGASAPLVADVFAGTAVDARVVSDRVGAASAVKMAYAAWTKGTAALLLAVLALARAEEIEPDLLAEWQLSLPDLPAASERAARSAEAKGWRWVGEMEEIAATFAADGLPSGFHEAAAEVFRGRR
jgi:3-hydroxyisobutyrate dehydrogenase-like beta-hydroxyacid dehydrogenase